MDKIYLLQHSYEKKYKGELFDETKTIGIYSTKEKAEEVVQKYKNIVGFKNHPVDCFYISEYPIDKDHWSEGFVYFEDIEADFETLTLCLNELLGFDMTVEESWKDNKYYQTLREVNEKVYYVKDAEELAAHISSVLSVRFNDNPKTTDECLNVATKILDSLILR